MVGDGGRKTRSYRGLRGLGADDSRRMCGWYAKWLKRVSTQKFKRVYFVTGTYLNPLMNWSIIDRISRRPTLGNSVLRFETAASLELLAMMIFEMA